MSFYQRRRLLPQRFRLVLLSVMQAGRTDVVAGSTTGGLWEGPVRTLASARAPPHASQRTANAPRELECVPDGEFLEAEFRESRAKASRELQLMFDPEFLYGFFGDQPIATSEEYYDQAVEIAGTGAGAAAADDADWMPLGVFGVVTDGQKTVEKSIQLALSKEGIIRGNLIDELTGEPKPVQGAVDKESQRVAISLTDDTSIVAEMGLYDLTQDTLTMMVHRGKDKVETRGLVRLTPPEQSGQASDPVTGAVDKETQRVAMKLEGNDSLVMEVGLYKFDERRSSRLDSFGRNKTRTANADSP